MTWFKRLLIANIAAQSGIIVTGAIVRVTGSGLGCPTWPECVSGSIVPTEHQTETWTKYVEFGNRTLTGVLGVIALAVAIAVFKKSKELRTRLWGLLPLAGTFAQAILGGITVLTGLHPLIVMAHFMLSIGLVAGCIRLWFLFTQNPNRGDSKLHKIFANVILLTTLVVITLGTIVTGTGPHSGDENVNSRFDFDPRIVTWIHADAVWLLIGLIVSAWVLRAIAWLPTASNTWLRWVTLVTLMQGAVGYYQHFTGLPELPVILHVLGATVLWISTVMFSSEVSRSPQREKVSIGS
jgi:cytochrome c oxidase assembly protein subunit 15